MSIAVLLGFLWTATALPDFLPETLGLARHPPDLWAVLTLYIALRARGFQAVGWGIAIGAVRDCVSLDPLGTHAFVLGTLAFLFCEGRGSRGRLDGGARLGLTALGVLAAGWLHLLRLLPVGDGLVTGEAFLAVLPITLWSVLLAAGLYPLLDRFGLLDELCGRTHAFPA